MKLGELKRSLSRFPPDMDDMEIVVKYINADGTEDVDLLVFVAYAQFKEDTHAIILGTWKAADRIREQGKNSEFFLGDYTTHPSYKPAPPNTGSVEQ